MQVVERMQKVQKDWSQAGLIIEYTKEVLKSFASWRFYYARPNSNLAAHLLAKDALSSDIDLYDLEEYLTVLGM